MTAGVSASEANGWLDGTLGTCFVQLHVGDPGAAGTSSVSAGSTTRVAITHNAASGGSATISGTNPAWTNGGTSETLTHVSFWSASSGGSFKGSATLTSSQAWASGNTFTLTANTWTITPIAA